MTSRSVKLPDIGEGVAEAEIVEWHVAVGDAVREDQIVAAVMTDKATVEIPSPVQGTILALGGDTGQVLSVGAELFRLDVADGSAAGSRPGLPAGEGVVAREQGPLAELGLDHARSAPEEAREPTAKLARPAASEGREPQRDAPVRLDRASAKPIASPAVRGRALEAGIDLRQVRGSGPAGRIGHNDLDALLRGAAEPAVPAPVGRRANEAVEPVKVVGLRRRIAHKMGEATRRAAHFSYVEEIDVTAVEDLRAALNGRFGASRSKLTLLPFLVQALVRTLPDFPQLNALYDDEQEVVHRHAGVHVGIATQTPAGLMVPVLRHAEARDLWDCAAEVKRLAEAARSGLAHRNELSGSTITITSLGALGGLLTTPVLNLPEVAIIGINKQVMRPLWRENAFVPRLTMNLSSSFDHRVVDGYDAALFVQSIKALLEAPAMLFMET